MIKRERAMYTTGTVPLDRFYLVQVGLFDNEKYYLPKVIPREYARVDNADAVIFNGQIGRVTHYDFFTRLHTVAVENKCGTYENTFYGREIVKILG